ncbi:hypothetical protein L226DRAFT_539935 [Lentinus tigrinus ALCF2SS1-7]|uniref:uncharacterized protein n=1 Tax=Lentinus tigrinus ALCF2SS1-7 TaxID=1328758 RepID=UPI0011660D64|nr:hypothetical protein L226DRAFT_539935 [Lentinus tigrinus ALCF2SS1-7]
MASQSFPLPKAYFVALFCEAILHGVYTVLFIGAMYLLLGPRRRQTKRTSLVNLAMVFLTVVMYALSTTHVALSLRQNLIAFFNQHAADGGNTILNDPNDPLVYSQIAIEVINCLLGDSIVCWRTWVLWGRDSRVIIPPALCIIGGFASGIGMVHAFSVSASGQEVYNADITRWFCVFSGLTCLANVYAVIAISFKAWQRMRAFRYLSSVTIHGGRYYKTLLVIIESGALYCIALIITISLFLSDNNGVYVITDMLGHLTGIYPTGIIVLVCLNMTFHDSITRTEKTLTTLQAEPGRTTSGLVNSKSLRTVLHLRKEGGSTSGADVMPAGSSETESGLELGVLSGSGKQGYGLGDLDQD